MKIKPLFYYSLFIFSLTAALQPVPASAACEGKRMVVFGDSLVAGFGLPPGKAFPEQLSTKLAEGGYAIEVVNAGVSGDTTSGGLSRLEWSIGESADLVVLELGGNDALRGIPVDLTRQNLEDMVVALKDKGTEIVLAGMLAPPNMGSKYGEAFNAIYPELASKHDITLYPFFLDGVAAESSLNLEDGIHPNTEGIGVMVEKILPVMKTKLQSICE
ncbi:MAG: arylesterase [Pseudomonadota bacterium]